METFHYIQSVYVDQGKAEMWIIDAGRENFLDLNTTIITRPARVFILDFLTNQVRLNFTFPDSVFPINSSFLNDIKVDPQGQRAYMSDTNQAGKGAIVAFDRRTNQSRRFEDPSSTYQDPNVTIRIDNVSYPTIGGPQDGITLSLDGEIVYYCAVRGQLLYAVNASMLFTASFSDLQSNVRVAYNKGTPSD